MRDNFDDDKPKNRPQFFVDIEGVRVQCCEYCDRQGELCGMPGTIQSGGPLWLCRPHHRLLSGLITDAEAAAQIKNYCVGLNRPVNTEFERRHAETLRERDAAGTGPIPRRAGQSLPYERAARHDASRLTP